MHARVPVMQKAWCTKVVQCQQVPAKHTVNPATDTTTVVRDHASSNRYLSIQHQPRPTLLLLAMGHGVHCL